MLVNTVRVFVKATLLTSLANSLLNFPVPRNDIREFPQSALYYYEQQLPMLGPGPLAMVQSDGGSWMWAAARVNQTRM